MTATDHADITELVLARARAVDDGDRDTFTSLLGEAVFVVAGTETTGSAIGGLIAEGPQLNRHLVTNLRIHVRGAEADAESFFTLLGGLGSATGARVLASGRYLDRLVLREGRWTFTRHEVVVDQST